jgi:charged multivesicular body protein 5
MAAMQAASKQLKTEHAKINIDHIEDMNDDLADMFEDMNEVGEALGRSFGVPDDIDEDELNAELACLGDEFEEEFDEEVSNPSYLQDSGMPNVPLNNPVTQQPQVVANDSSVDEFGLPVQNIQA